jgi:5S rRNA maturation endonuclease (ribonuclease M5)
MPLDRLEAELSAAGCMPKRRGDALTARCPVHDDKTPSLCASLGDDGRGLLHCQAGCRTEDVVAAIGLAMSDLCPERPKDDRPQIICTYGYTDENGELLYEVVRYVPKDFRQRRPDGRGGYEWNLRGVERVPYRLPEVLSAVAADRVVYVVEGEKDADRLDSLGLVATCNAGGAGKWPAKWGQIYFTGAKIVVLPDNDDAGRKHAEQVAQSLHGHAAEVRVVELPGLGAKQDASDWLTSGHDAEELRKLVHQSPAWEPKPHKPPADDAATADLRSTRALLRAVSLVLKKYIAFSSLAQVTAVALWVLHTYVFETFETTPYLAITSAVKRSGKSRLLELLTLLVSRPWYVTEPTEAVLFRKVEASAPTLLVDEVDATFGKDSTATEGLRAIYNSGYRKGSTVPRCVGNDHEVRDFRVYCPKVFAGIKKLPDTVADRSIPVVLRRRAPTERVPDRFRIAVAKAALGPLRAALAAWGEAHAGELAGAYPDLPDELTDRGQDAWEPLLAIADLAGVRWGARARAAAVELAGDEQDGDLGVALLNHCREAFGARDKLTTRDLLDHLVNRGDETLWARWWADDLDHDRSKGPASRLAALLKPFDVHPTQVWVDGAKGRGYRREDFEPAWQRYCPTDAVPSPTAPSNGRTVDPRSEPISGSGTHKPKSAPDQDPTVLPSLPSVGGVTGNGRRGFLTGEELFADGLDTIAAAFPGAEELS